jgi:hypothetical protein
MAIDEAAVIATSGRWEAVNERIAFLCRKPAPHDGWWVELFSSLCQEIFSEYLSMKGAYENKRYGDSAVIAWRSRNLLELSVCAIFCAKSIDNTRRVYEDAGRDVRGIFDVFIKWGTATAQPSDWLDPISTAKEELAAQALSEHGIDSLDGPYKEVRDAAEECGFGLHFNAGFKLASKFAHPTAMRILAQYDETKEALLQDIFFSQGCLYFVGAFGAIEGLLVPPPRPSTPKQSSL